MPKAALGFDIRLFPSGQKFRHGRMITLTMLGTFKLIQARATLPPSEKVNKFHNQAFVHFLERILGWVSHIIDLLCTSSSIWTSE